MIRLLLVTQIFFSSLLVCPAESDLTRQRELLLSTGGPANNRWIWHGEGSFGWAEPMANCAANLQAGTRHSGVHTISLSTLIIHALHTRAHNSTLAVHSLCTLSSTTRLWHTCVHNSHSCVSSLTIRYHCGCLCSTNHQDTMYRQNTSELLLQSREPLRLRIFVSLSGLLGRLHRHPLSD